MRNGRSAIMMTLLVAVALALASCAAPDAGRTPSVSGGAPAGTADGLDACLAAIPKDATAGQRTLAEQTCNRNASARASVVGAGTAAATSAYASGTAGDTLAACMARIPKDASAGQRMVAEGSCKRDEGGRQAIAAIPGQ